MNETTVQGHTITRKAVEAFLRGTEPVPPLRNASFYVVREDGAKVATKQVIYALTDGAGHWGNEAAQALLRLGFTVRVRRRAKTHSTARYAGFVVAGLLVFDQDVKPDPTTKKAPKPPARETFDPAQLEDTRRLVLSARHERAGQPEFRSSLLRAYGGRCAISGCNAVVALEAAHIAPHKGRETNRVDNGLLLRSDLHLLFDAGLLGIEPETMTVVIDKSLAKTEYAKLGGTRIGVPESATELPSKSALEFRRDTIGPPRPRAKPKGGASASTKTARTARTDSKGAKK